VIAAAAALSVAKPAASAVIAVPAPRLKRSVHSRSSTAGPTSALMQHHCKNLSIRQSAIVMGSRRQSFDEWSVRYGYRIMKADCGNVCAGLRFKQSPEQY